jgi:hypothetical protein
MRNEDAQKNAQCRVPLSPPGSSAEGRVVPTLPRGSHSRGRPEASVP